MNVVCPKCRSRGLTKCFCIIRERIKLEKNIKQSFKKEFFGENYNVFVGRFGYPNVNVGLLSLSDPKKDELFDNPQLWAEKNLDINTIINLRTQMINANIKADIKKTRLTETYKELSLTNKPTDTEIVLEKAPMLKISFNAEATPYGPSIKLEKARITENPKIPQKVEQIVNDDLLADEALNMLHKRGFDEHYLTKIFSIGNLGKSTRKKLVPTRWSITAVDDTLGKDMIEEIKDYKHSEYQIYFGGYLGNYYLIMLFSEPWSYELFETLVRTKEFMTDTEGYNGRKKYAYQTVGGYYAARFSILQKLKEKKIQASILALRFVTDEYWAPLGVWVVRQASKRAMDSKPLNFESRESMIKYAADFAKKRFEYNIDNMTSQSVIIKNLSTQKKLIEF